MQMKARVSARVKFLKSPTLLESQRCGRVVSLNLHLIGTEYILHGSSLIVPKPEHLTMNHSSRFLVSIRIYP